MHAAAAALGFETASKLKTDIFNMEAAAADRYGCEFLDVLCSVLGEDDVNMRRECLRLRKLCGAHPSKKAKTQ